MEIKGITVVSPMWGDRTKTDRMVASVIHQFISKNNPFNIHASFTPFIYTKIYSALFYILIIILNN